MLLFLFVFGGFVGCGQSVSFLASGPQKES
jgi:hypothetical protein